MRAKSTVSGASTLWIQTAEITTVPPVEREGVPEKIGDFLRAVLIRQKFTPEQALELYLNSANYAGSDRGIKAGARAFFDKDPKDLNLAESALLAVVPQGPGANNANTYANARLWVSKADNVLREMGENGFIDAAMRDSAKLDVHQLIEPDATGADLEFVLKQAFINEAEVSQVRLLAQEYVGKGLSERTNIEGKYVNFYETLLEKGIINQDEFDSLT